jgi:Double-GTPase 2
VTEDTTRGCSQRSCFDPETIGCNQGNNLADCLHRQQWLKDQGSASAGEPATATGTAAPGAADSDRDLRLPWTGNTFGTWDVHLVSASNRTALIGVIGPYNSGKTTLLTSLYLLMARGEQLPEWRFAASTTLGGWGRLAENLRWDPPEVPPKFPEHTSRGTGRRPGLLHLAVRGVDQVRRDYLLTDPPGEWFTDWATKADHDGAEGARWIARYAERFLFLIDCEALSGPERGKARDGYRELARRLAEARLGRAVAVVWTKSDQAIPQTIETALTECFERELPGHAEFKVRVRFGNEDRETVEAAWLDLMKWAFAPQSMAGLDCLTEWRSDSRDPFLSYRGPGPRISS